MVFLEECFKNRLFNRSSALMTRLVLDLSEADSIIEV